MAAILTKVPRGSIAHRPGKLHDNSSIHGTLHCRTCLGELKHCDEYVENTHPASINKKPLWDEVHAQLQVNGRACSATSRGKVDFLLKGLLTGPDGRAFSPSHMTKANGRAPTAIA